MKRSEKIMHYIDSLCIYNLKDDRALRLLHDILACDDDSKTELYGSFFNYISYKGAFKNYVSNLILSDENVFTRLACCDEPIPQTVIKAVRADLEKLEAVSSVTFDDIKASIKSDDFRELFDSMPEFEYGTASKPLDRDWNNSIDELIEYHKQNGYGIYSKNIAFKWRNNSIIPIEHIDTITLYDLKNYEEQRQRVIDNTESFIAGHPANNVLLYGDRGTGKSSTVHAILNEYHSRGLRMIEIPKSAVCDLSVIMEAISDSPLKFIIYIDDLSFDTNDSSFNELKAALEGSLSGRQSNTVIYATSNRRHLIKESFSDRQNEINKNDIMQEQLSLSDRFGLTITFLNPNKADFFDIVKKIALDRRLNVDAEELCFKADRWAIRKGGRSPRCAKQFIDYVESCLKRNKQW